MLFVLTLKNNYKLGNFRKENTESKKFPKVHCCCCCWNNSWRKYLLGFLLCC